LLFSASLMTTAVKGLPHSDAMALFGRVHSMLTTETVDEAALVEVGKLAVLSGVWEYPARVKCATLAWQALRNALADGGRRGEKE
jgi:nitrogen fixation NifU-like protein